MKRFKEAKFDEEGNVIPTYGELFYWYGKNYTGGVTRNRKNWMKKAFSKHKAGSLHRQLGYPVKQKIPKNTLLKIKRTKTGNKIYLNKKSRTVTLLMKRRANLAYVARKR